MANYQVKLDLKKLELAGVAKIKDKECLIIPIAENDLYVSRNQDGSVRAVYLDLSLWERKEQSLYGDTHNIKQSLGKEFRERIGEEAVRAKPFLGSVREIKRNDGQQVTSAPVVQYQIVQTQDDSKDDLPF